MSNIHKRDPPLFIDQQLAMEGQPPETAADLL